MVDWANAAEHQVLYRLARWGFDAERMASGQASIVACNDDGSRVALIVVKCRQAPGGYHVGSSARVGRNLFYVFVDFSNEATPPCFIVASALVVSALAGNPAASDAWTAAWLEPHREAWSALGLDRPALAVAS